MVLVEHDNKLGLKPPEKYGPTGDPITAIIDAVGVLTPKEFYIDM
jgi:hypothetical protein